MPPLPPDGPSGTPDRLARLRGRVPPQPYSARKITALTENPACGRRAVLDAAGVDKATLAIRVGHQPRFGQSPFTLARTQEFLALVKWGGFAELIRLMREELQAPVEEAAIADLTEIAGNRSLPVRELATRRLVERLAEGKAERLVLDCPVLTLEVAGRLAYLEPDAITHRIGGRFYVVGIKSFAAIDGQADPRAVAQAAKQAAVHVLALRRAFDAAGLGPEMIAHEFLLICPKDFANRPYGRLVDVRQELDALAFQLERLRRAEDIAALLSPDATFDVSASRDELSDSLSQLGATYRPDCLSFCELSRFCRHEAISQALPARLGSGVRNALPGIDSTRTALAHLDGAAMPSAAEAPTVALLRAADRLRRLRQGGAA